MAAAHPSLLLDPMRPKKHARRLRQHKLCSAPCTCAATTVAQRRIHTNRAPNIKPRASCACPIPQPLMLPHKPQLLGHEAQTLLTDKPCVSRASGNMCWLMSASKCLSMLHSLHSIEIRPACLQVPVNDITLLPIYQLNS